MGVTTSLHRRDRHLFKQWWGRTTAAVTLVALLAVVLTLTGIVRQGDPDVTTPVGAPAGPATSAPAAETRIPAVAAAAPAVVEPVAVVRRAPLADRYPGALLDAPDGILGAYQRAAAIINATADCHLDWMTLAAIARIESNHGQGPGKDHEVTDDGLVKPRFVGKPLNGKKGRGTVDDTDAGKVDGNKRWDAPVGPFGLLPATWATVAVDADGDDVRNPQDVDDASLAAAVVLCAGGKDLADARTLRKALTAYHRTRGFAATVVQLSALYAEEMEAAPVPVFMAAPGLLPIPDDLAEICDCAREDKKSGQLHVLPGAKPPTGPSGGGTPPPTDPGTPGDGGGPSDPPSDPPADPVEPPADPVEPPPATEPDPPPAPVETPSEPDPEPSPERTEAVEPEPAPEPALASEPVTEPDAEAAREPEADVAPTTEG